VHAQFSFSDDVRLMDGGTQGIFLLPWVRNAKHLLIFDAIDFGLPPATLKLIRDDDVPRFMGVKKMSMHQTGFQEVLFSAELTDVKAQIEPAISMACDVLAEWGVTAVAREGATSGSELVGPGALDIHDYEDGRPF